jgi:hypothetical protein
MCRDQGLCWFPKFDSLGVLANIQPTHSSFPDTKSETYGNMLHFSTFNSSVNSSGQRSHRLCFYVEIDV